MEGKKSAQSGRLGPSFSARLAPRRPHGGGGREDFSEPTECASVRVATGARSTACSAIFRRRTTRLSEITACKVQTCNATALVIVEVRRGTSHSRKGAMLPAGEADEASPTLRDAPWRRVAKANFQRTRNRIKTLSGACRAPRHAP